MRNINLISNLHCLAAHFLNGKATGFNPEEKPGDGIPTAVRRCMQTRSGNSCDAIDAKLFRYSPFLWAHQLHGKGEFAAWATAGSP